METAPSRAPWRAGTPQRITWSPPINGGGVPRANAPAAVYFEVGVFETTPLLGGRSGFDWSTSQDFGTTVPVEIGWEPHFGRDALPAHFKTGFYYDSSTQPDVLYNIDGTPIPLSGLPPRGDTGHIGVWAGADAMLVRHPTGPDAGLTAFVNYTHADPNISPFQDLVFVGFEDKGLIAARPADGFGAQIIWARQSSQVQTLQEIQSSLGEPLAFGGARSAKHRNHSRGAIRCACLPRGRGATGCAVFHPTRGGDG
jgi:porin